MVFDKGASYLSDAEILALIIQKGFGQENAVDLANRNLIVDLILEIKKKLE